MVLGHRKNSLTTSARGSTEAERSDVEGDDQTVVSEEQGNVLTHIISQLRPGADLSRVTLPTFILEPRSMLERITNFMAHPETLLHLPTIDDPIERFAAVTKFYLSGWHIKPPGVKKPLNPILGEIFTGYWDYPDGTKGYYISEQTSHHPPKSSYFFMAPEHHIRIDGTLKPRSKFLGNSVGSFMEGIAVMRFLNRDERYFITQPNMYARGILFGKMKYELGDHAIVKSPEMDLEADIEFKVKGWVGGGYNAILGYIKKSSTGKNLFELSGHWNEKMYIKDLATGKKSEFFDATNAKPSIPKARPIDEQAPRESQKLWQATTQAIKRADHKGATDEKSKIEDEQRREAAERGETPWQPKLFRAVPAGDEEKLDWIIDAEVDYKAPAQKQVEQILAIAPILPGQRHDEAFDEQEKLPSQQGKQMPQSSAQSAGAGPTPEVAAAARNFKDQDSHRLPIRGNAAVAQHTQQQNDLIDFGQNDGANDSRSAALPQADRQPTNSSAQSAPVGSDASASSPQEPLMPSQTTPAGAATKPLDYRNPTQPGKAPSSDTLRRQDSIGGEDVFHDAES
ncbi:Putative oxysterol-binding protein [Septoria linicola]|uniref:Oxysterol-binding protein n=1 Tax=Septoria linicola TaxID=215465 RepID=A0A9Q9EEZ7_9PEZI|nr:putative oxysterol-binding protein [Septoria linicola]USW49306.1 Putative oxysterol-binding protein [Septoria linicola]